LEEDLTYFELRVIGESKFSYNINIGIKIDLGWQRNGALRLYVAGGFLQNFIKSKDYSTDGYRFLVGQMSEIEFFRGGLGSSLLNLEKFKINIEIRNSFIGLLGWNNGEGGLAGKPAFVTVGSNRSILYDPLDVSLSFGTTFINGINHKRNQQIGTFSLSIFNLSIQYYNDATPFQYLALSDAYDRYWTGGGQIGIYKIDDTSLFTQFVCRFDNYTGYQLNLFEVAGKLRIDSLPYKDRKQQMFNQGSFQYKLGVRNMLFLNFSVFEPEFTDIQDLIHYRISNSPFHARPLDTRFTIGLDYKYNISGLR